MVKKKKGILCLFSLDKIFDLIEAELLLEEDAEYFTLEDINFYILKGFNFFEFDPQQMDLFDLLD